MIIDHIGVKVSDYPASKAFYAKALAPLGYELIYEHNGEFCGFGRGQKPEFWISQGEPAAGLHIAFAASDRASVDAFYEAAIAAGGRDNGKPGPRPYHEHYYGAFAFDPDGLNVEAVCHAPA